MTRDHSPSFAVRFSVVSVFAIAMAWVEAAVVVYGRALYYGGPDPLRRGVPLINVNYGSMEIGREAATIVMLLLVGWLAGQRRAERIAWFCVAWGVWDVFYYVWLAAFAGWPVTLLDWDELFFIPMPWWGPVLAPLLCCAILIGGGALAAWRLERGLPLAQSRVNWSLMLTGSVIIIGSFMEDALRLLPRGYWAVWFVRPTEYNWRLFAAGYAIGMVGVVRIFLPPRAVTATAARDGLRTAVVVLVAGSLIASHPTAARSQPERLVEAVLDQMPAWARALAAYVHDPEGQAPLLLAMADREGLDGLPPVVLLALAEAQLRRGRPNAARRMFALALASDPGDPWATWGRLGDSFAALAAGRRDAARARLAEIGDSWLPAAKAGVLLVAVLDAEKRDPSAADRLDALARDWLAPAGVRRAAHLLSGYARYWRGAHDEAAATFADAAAALQGSILADDAAYAEAWSHRRAGRTAIAREKLERLAATAPAPSRRRAVSRARLDLQADTLLRDAVRRLRSAPFHTADALGEQLLNVDGVALAQAALLVTAADTPDVEHVPRSASTATRDPATAPGLIARSVAPAERTLGARGDAPTVRNAVLLVLAITLVALLLAARALRGRA